MPLNTTEIENNSKALAATLKQAFDDRKDSTRMYGHRAELGRLTDQQPWLRLFSEFREVSNEVEDDDVRITLEVSRLLSNRFAVELRIAYSTDGTAFKVSAYGNLVEFLDKQGFGSRNWKTLVEGETFEGELEDSEAFSHVLKRVLREMAEGVTGLVDELVGFGVDDSTELRELAVKALVGKELLADL